MTTHTRPSTHAQERRMPHPYVLHLTAALWAARDALSAVDEVIL